MLLIEEKQNAGRGGPGAGGSHVALDGTVAYGAQSSVIESVSVSFKTIYGEPEEIPEPEVTVSGKSCSLGMCSTAQIMTTGNRGARSGGGHGGGRGRKILSPQPRTAPNARSRALTLCQPRPWMIPAFR